MSRTAALSPRDRNRALNLTEYRSGQDRLDSNPQYVMVELTQGCNLSCPMCRTETLSYKGRTMTLDLFEQIAETVFDTATMIDLRGWGESLLLPHIDYCVARAVHSSAQVRFVTNLTMKAPPFELLAQAACHIAVSVDTVDRDLYKVLRRGADFDRLKTNLGTLVETYRCHGAPVDRIVLTCTVTEPGLSRLPELATFAVEMGVMELRLFEVFAEAGSTLSLSGADAKVDAALAAMRECVTGKPLKIVIGSRLGTMPLKDVGEAACLHPWSYVLFAHDGGVGFCDHLNGPDGENYILGSLHESTFEDIWNGPAWCELRREHAGARRETAANFHECAWCYKHRLVDFEHMFASDMTQTLLIPRCRR